MLAARGQAPKKRIPATHGKLLARCKEGIILSPAARSERGAGAGARAREPRANHAVLNGGSDGGEDKWREGGRGCATTRREGRRSRGRTVRGGRRSNTELEVDDRAIAVVSNVPLEFVREVARASAVAEAGHVEGGSAARHDVELSSCRASGWVKGRGAIEPREKFQVSAALRLACDERTLWFHGKRGRFSAGPNDGNTWRTATTKRCHQSMVVDGRFQV